MPPCLGDEAGRTWLMISSAARPLDVEADESPRRAAAGAGRAAVVRGGRFFPAAASVPPGEGSAALCLPALVGHAECGVSNFPRCVAAAGRARGDGRARAAVIQSNLRPTSERIVIRRVARWKQKNQLPRPSWAAQRPPRLAANGKCHGRNTDCVRLNAEQARHHRETACPLAGRR